MEIESTNHQDVAEPDQMVSGMAGTGQENNEQDNKKGQVKNPQRLVERKTELQGMFIRSNRIGLPGIRKRTEMDLNEAGAGIPDERIEAALQDLMCSFRECDDRMNEKFFLRITNLKLRVLDLEDQLRALEKRVHDVERGEQQ